MSVRTSICSCVVATRSEGCEDAAGGDDHEARVGALSVRGAQQDDRDAARRAQEHCAPGELLDAGCLLRGAHARAHAHSSHSWRSQAQQVRRLLYSYVQLDEYRQEISALKSRVKQLSDELHSSRQSVSDYESTISRLRIEIQEGSLRAEKSVIEVRTRTLPTPPLPDREHRATTHNLRVLS